MKRCPECSTTYPDSERFCSSDGAQLVPAEAGGRATVQMPPPAEKELAVECPVCGGKALPGEELCSFCGARLGSAEVPPPQPSFTIPRQTVVQAPTPEAPSGGPYFDDERTREPSGSGRFFAFTGYLVAAVVALAAGAWFALHLTHTGLTSKPAPSAAPAASPAITGPVAQLASNSNVQVTGESASDPARNTNAATKLFNDNSAAVLDLYKKALAGDGNLSDGVLASVTVNPAGSVVAGSVKTSTTPNPALDADLVKTMMGWHFAPFSGSSVEVSYPVVMARNAEEKASVEAALADKIANLNPSETPEYASAPAVPPGAVGPTAEASAALAATEPITPPAAPPEGAPSGPGASAPPVGGPAPAAEAPGSAALAPPPVPYAPERPRRRRPRVSRPIPPPPRVDLLTRVQERLRNDRRLGRVKAYTNGGGVVTLYGKVFDDRFRHLAVSTVRSVDGVTDVIDSLQTDTAGWAQQESAIAAQLQGAGLSQVSVKVIGHDAYLSGEVSTEVQKEHAVTIAEGAAPVRVRTNLIRVVPRGVFSF